MLATQPARELGRRTPLDRAWLSLLGCGPGLFPLVLVLAFAGGTTEDGFRRSRGRNGFATLLARARALFPDRAGFFPQAPVAPRLVVRATQPTRSVRLFATVFGAVPSR